MFAFLILHFMQLGVEHLHVQVTLVCVHLENQMLMIVHFGPTVLVAQLEYNDSRG